MVVCHRTVRPLDTLWIDVDHGDHGKAMCVS